MSTSSASELTSTTSGSVVSAGHARRGAGSCPARTRGVIASGGCEQQRVGAGPMAVGDDQRRSVGARAARAARRARSGSSSGQSPGTSSTRSRSDIERVRGCRRARRRCGRGRRRRAPSRRSRRRSAARRGRAVTTTISSIDGARRSATSTSENIASTSARRVGASSSSREPLLGLVKALDREDRERSSSAANAIRTSDRANRSVCSATARRSVRGRRVEHVGLQHGHRRGALVGDEAVDQRRA